MKLSNQPLDAFKLVVLYRVQFSASHASTTLQLAGLLLDGGKQSVILLQSEIAIRERDECSEAFEARQIGKRGYLPKPRILYPI